MQISDRSYETEMLEEGIDKILELGIAFSGKHVIIKTK